VPIKHNLWGNVSHPYKVPLYEYGPAGDQCCGYKVRTEKTCTVKEFIEEILKQRTDEWGTFEITKLEEMKYYTGKEQQVDYEKGGKLKGTIPPETAGKSVKAVKARGGWTAMNYFIGV